MEKIKVDNIQEVLEEYQKLSEGDDKERIINFLEAINFEKPIDQYGIEPEYAAKIIVELKEHLQRWKLGYLKTDKEKLKKEIEFFYNKRHLAEQFTKMQPLYFDEALNWWMWNLEKKKWQIIDETDLLNALSHISSANTINSKEKGEIIEALRQVARLNKPKPIKESWIQFKDEFFDLVNGNRYPAIPSYFATNPIPYKIHPELYEHTPTIDKIFEEWVGKEHVKTLYQIIAYCMIPDYPIHRIFCFIGSGMNGKSKFMELLRKFIGADNVCSTELDILLQSRFEVTRLHKKLVCQMGETNFNEMSKTSILKKLSGGDLIGFEYKRKNPFEEKNYAKIIISTNNLPSTTDKTVGFYRRWMIIDFPNEFSEQKDILKEIPEEEYQSLALKCTSILSDLLKERKFNREGSIEERMKRYEDHSDPLEKFLREFCSEDFNGFVWKHELEKKLNEWCKENRFRQLSEVAIGKKMKDKGFEVDREQAPWITHLSERRLRVWRGIKWKDNLSGQDGQDGQVNPS